MANYDDHLAWDARLELQARTIAAESPDVVALQEPRFNPLHPSTARTWRDMAEQLLARLVALDGDAWRGASLLAQAAMWYDVPPGKTPPPPFPGVAPGQEREGLAILARLPVLETGAAFLPASPGDANRRIAQYALLQASRGPFLVCNAHFTYDERGLAGNVAGTLALATRAGTAPLALLGDFNATPDAEGLRGLARSGLVDAWAALRPGEAGFTHDVTASGGPTRRIDYAWVSPALRGALRDVRLVNVASVDDVFASDHAGLVLDLDA